MEFSFNVNNLLPDTITLVDDKLAPFRSRVKNDRSEFANKQSQLKTVIDKMGEASTRAQGLRAPITSAIKLQHSEQRLYIMKDPVANNGLGAAVGIIKVGQKKLFLLDMQSVQYEVHPLCVLDFYIHETRQRTGCGKRLFEHMLKMEGRVVHHLAIDRPSHKFVSFLKKYYGLKNAIPQANNFVIHEHFFSDLEAVGYVPRRSQRFGTQNASQSGRPPIHPYRRTSQSNGEPSLLHKRHSSSSRPNSGREFSALSSNTVEGRETDSRDHFRINDSLQDINLPLLVPRPLSRNSTPGSRGSSAGRRPVTREMELRNTGATSYVRSEAFNASRGLAARATRYSRHSNRGGSADIIKSKRSVEAMDSTADSSSSYLRSNSGGRIRSLHLTSAENPFHGQQSATVQMAEKQQHEQVTQIVPSNGKPKQDHNSNVSDKQPSEAETQSGLTPSGNFSVTSLFNSHFGVRPPFIGSSWNIFGVPTYSSSANNMYTRRTNQRHHPF